MWTSHPVGDRQDGERYKIASLYAILIIILVTSSFAGLHLRSDLVLPSESAQPWLYLRLGQAIAPSETPVVLIVVGDLMLGRGMASRLGVLAQVAPEIRAADLALGNFEGAIPVPGTHPADLPSDDAYEPYRLLVPASAAGELRGAGFDLLSLANNHRLDAGEAGLQNTLAELGAAGITALGEGIDASSASRWAVRQFKDVSIAILAFNRVPLPPFLTGNTSLDIHREPTDDMLSELVRQARAQADVVIVSLHWGEEYQLQPNPGQKELAIALLQAGADLVLGHHPHVVQEIEITHLEGEESPPRSQLVAYSLGNFAFDQGWEETGQGLALQIYLDKQGLRALQALPVWNTPRPRWMELDEARALLERVSPPPPRLGFTCIDGACQPASVPQEKTSGLFWSGQVDLTGDGEPEVIRRVGGSVIIYQDGKQAWHSPPEWQVVDLALGDPNNDGRLELVLAVCKPASPGGETSHPFILGYRGGIYRLLWGGSAVRDPILEVELGDVTGDDIQELLVLEQSASDGGSYLTVWSWHGWGFSQLWRSPGGSYRDLNFTPGGNQAAGSMSVSSPLDGARTP